MEPPSAILAAHWQPLQRPRRYSHNLIICWRRPSPRTLLASSVSELKPTAWLLSFNKLLYCMHFSPPKGDRARARRRPRQTPPGGAGTIWFDWPAHWMATGMSIGSPVPPLVVLTIATRPCRCPRGVPSRPASPESQPLPPEGARPRNPFSREPRLPIF